MRVARLAVCGALMASLAGCDYVSSVHPIGAAPLHVEESEWAGTWVHDDGALTVRVVDAEQGRLEAAWAEEKGGVFVLESVELYLRQGEGWTFASFAGVEEAPDFLFSRLVRNEEQLFLWWPRPGEFKRLVEAGLLPGKIEDGDVLLGQLAAEHLAIIASEEHGMLFEWDEPMTFSRLP